MFDVTLREFEESDRNFILNSWLKSYRNSDASKKIPNDVYYHFHAKLIEKYIAESTVVMAVNPDNPIQIFGYAVVNREDNTIHYVYTKHTYRKLGIAKRLIEVLLPDLGESPTCCTATNYAWRQYQQKYSLYYNPYAN